MNAPVGLLQSSGFAVSSIGDASFGSRDRADRLLIVEGVDDRDTSDLTNLALAVAAEMPTNVLILPPRRFDLARPLSDFDWSQYRGAVILTTGPRMVLVPGSLTARGVEYQFTGKASHASTAPERGSNALESAMQTISLVNGLRQHVLSEIRIDLTLPYGGEAPNIVPERSVLRAWVRAPGISSLRQTLLKMRDAAQSAALSNRGTADSFPITVEIPGLFAPPAFVSAALAGVSEFGIGKVGLFEHAPLAAGAISPAIPTIGLTIPTDRFDGAADVVRSLLRVPDDALRQGHSELAARRTRIQAFAESNGVGSPVW